MSDSISIEGQSRPRQLPKMTAKEIVMVELSNSTFATAEAENGKLVVEAARKVTHYITPENTKIPMADEVAARLSGRHIVLLDAGVKVTPSDIKRIVGPLDCDEAVRIRARKYTTNWGDRAFVEIAAASDLRAALDLPTEGETYRAMCALRAAAK
jgi:hypothetical protein